MNIYINNEFFYRAILKKKKKKKTLMTRSCRKIHPKRAGRNCFRFKLNSVAQEGEHSVLAVQ